MNRVTLVTCILFGLGACATGGRSVEPQPGTPQAESNPTEALLEIDSRFPGPVTVWATRGVLRVRLGTVTIGRVLRLSVPQEFVGQGRVVRLLARPVGGGGQVTTETFDVDLGDRVMWTVIEPLASSVATLRITVGGP